MFYRIVRYLKPSFSNHPLNYIFTFIIFTLFFLITKTVNADQWPLTQLHFPTGDNQSVATACSNAAQRTCSRTNLGQFNGVTCWQWASSHRNVYMTFCEDSNYNPFGWDVYQQNQCPAAGTTVFNIYGPTGPVNIAGCLAVPNKVEVSCDPEIIELMPPEYRDQPCHAFRGYAYTGEPATTHDGNPLPELEQDEFKGELNTEPLGVLPNTQETTIDRQFESWPDGSTTETVTTVTTENRGAGSTREETETAITVTYSNGITRTETTTETTITHPDGSKTVTTDKTISFTQSPVNTINVTKPDTVNKTTGTPKQSTQATTTTETFDSNGNKTGSSTTSSGSGDQVGGGSGDGDGEGEGCEDCDPPNYEESGSWWESNYPDGLAGILDEHREALLSASGIAQMTDAGIGGGGSFPVFTFPGWTIGPMAVGPQTIDLDPRVVPFMRAALLFLAAIMCRRLVFGG